MVFIGAFFLMNLTLAVINAAFSQTNTTANESDPFGDFDEDNEGPDLDEIEEIVAKNGEHDEIGISEFFVAKRAAKHMIEFLRARQVEKAN